MPLSHVAVSNHCTPTSIKVHTQENNFSYSGVVNKMVYTTSFFEPPPHSASHSLSNIASWNTRSVHTPFWQVSIHRFRLYVVLCVVLWPAHRLGLRASSEPNAFPCGSVYYTSFVLCVVCLTQGQLYCWNMDSKGDSYSTPLPLSLPPSGSFLPCASSQFTVFTFTSTNYKIVCMLLRHI